MSLTLRLSIALTLAAAIPLLVVVWPRLTSIGTGDAWSLIFAVGWSLIIVALVGVAAWFWSHSTLRPLNDLVWWVRRGMRGESRVREPLEVRVLRAALLHRDNERSNKESERSLYVSTLIHDMKTPLLAVHRSLGFAMKDATALEVERWLGPTRDEVQSILGTVQDIVDVDRLERGMLPLTVAEVDLLDLTQRVATRLKVARPELPVVVRGVGTMRQQADADLVRRALENVVGNAVRFARSRVDIDVTPGMVRVADDGPGMTGDVTALMDAHDAGVEEDASAPSEHRSTGLGLFIAKAILEAHGGRLVLESTGPMGTVTLMYVAQPRGHRD